MRRILRTVTVSLFLGPTLPLNMESDCDDQELKNRIENINKLKSFLNDVDIRIKNIVGELNWDYEKLCTEKIDTVLCSVNPQHRVPKSSLKDHEDRCKWLHEGYQLDDKPFPEFSDNGFCIAISPELQSQIIAVAASKTDHFEIDVCSSCVSFLFLKGSNNADRPVPKTSNRLEQDFTKDERLAIYDYVVANTQRKGSFSDFTFLSAEERKEKKREMEQWEIAAAERDAKRRRASYRNKVHTNKKTHTEILREVIESQMECLKEECVKEESLPKMSQKSEREKEKEIEEEDEDRKSYKKHGDRSSHKNSKPYDNGHRDSHKHKKSHHHERHKKSHKRRDRSTSRSRNKKHKKSVSRSRSREKHRKSSSSKSYK